MLEVHYTNRFIKELKLSAKRGKNINKLEFIMEKLTKEEALESKYRDHNLIGQHKHRRECHVENNWLLIYKVEGKAITFERIGTHADLFK